jgi:hypothetical protein
MNPMICSSVNLLFLMSVILQVDGLRCHYAGTAGRGQVIVHDISCVVDNGRYAGKPYAHVRHDAEGKPQKDVLTLSPQRSHRFTYPL